MEYIDAGGGLKFPKLELVEFEVYGFTVFAYYQHPETKMYYGMTHKNKDIDICLYHHDLDELKLSTKEALLDHLKESV